MLKTTLITAAALSLMVLGASTAQAGGKHHKFYWDYSFVLSDDDDCEWESHPVKIKVWDDDGDYHWKTVWKGYWDCD